MPNKLISMQKICQVLHFYAQGKGTKTISNLLNMSRNTVKKYLQLSQQLDESFDSLLELSDSALCSLFDAGTKPSAPNSALIATALDFYGTSDDSLRKSKAYYYQGRYYEEHKEPELLVKCFLRSLTAIESMNMSKYVALCSSHLGYVNSSQGLYDKSLLHFKKAAKHFEEVKNIILRVP